MNNVFDDYQTVFGQISGLNEQEAFSAMNRIHGFMYFSNSVLMDLRVELKKNWIDTDEEFNQRPIVIKIDNLLAQANKPHEDTE